MEMLHIDDPGATHTSDDEYEYLYMYYTIIVGYRHLNMDLLYPKRARHGKDGKPIFDKYDKPYEDDCSRSEITKYPISARRTSKDSMDQLQADVKWVINAIKGFLNETASTLCYHNANCDAMSQFGERHFHTVTLIDSNLDGSPQELIIRHASEPWSALWRKMVAIVNGSKWSRVQNCVSVCAVHHVFTWAVERKYPETNDKHCPRHSCGV